MRIVHFTLPSLGSDFLRAFLENNEEIVAVVSSTPSGWDPEAIKSAKSKNIPFLSPKDLKDAKFLDSIKSLNPDLIICASFNKRFPEELLDLPPLGCINVHQSLLPKYRGANPYCWVIINNEKETGTTLHYMDEGFDTGDIIAQRSLKIEDSDNSGTIFAKTNRLGIDMVMELLADLKAGKTLSRKPQEKGEFPKAPHLKENDVQIDFSKNSADILRVIRAGNPIFAAFCLLRSKRLFIFNAEENRNAISLPNYKACRPGEVIGFTDSGEMMIKTGDSSVFPKIVFFDAYLTGKEFTSYLAIKPGEIFS